MRLQLFLACLWVGIVSHAFANEVHLTLASGRSVSGMIDPATSSQTIWLRSQVGQAILRRPIDVAAIDRIEIHGQRANLNELQQLAANANAAPARSSTAEKSIRDIRPGKIIVIQPAAPSTPTDTFVPQAKHLPPVTLRIDAYPANWDADAEDDGLLVSITPLDREGTAVPVTGVAQIEWWGSQVVSRWQTPVGRESYRPLRWAYQSENLTAEQFSTGYRVQLPFQGMNPLEQALVFPYSLVRVRLVVPGVGELLAERDGIRAHRFQPLLDFSRRGTDR